VQLSKRLGFDIIEGNVRKTSDGKYIVMHGERKNGQTCFGDQVEHIDGVTDVSSDPINSWTLADIQTYLRYKSIYPKYRTKICSLEEWLCEVVNQKLFPLIQVPDSTANDIIISYMGKDNYIAYAGKRSLTNGMI
jgi:glycerophosphoryl diester phosphodiesterase